MAGLPDLELQAFLIGAGDYSYYHCSCANAFGGNIWGSASKWLAQPRTRTGARLAAMHRARLNALVRGFKSSPYAAPGANRD